jgi:hypothetical protein
MLSGHGARLKTSLLQVVINNVGTPFLSLRNYAVKQQDGQRKQLSEPRSAA